MHYFLIIIFYNCLCVEDTIFKVKWLGNMAYELNKKKYYFIMIKCTLFFSNFFNIILI